METQSRGKGLIFLFLTFFLWGSIYVGAKLLSGAIMPMTLACLRCAVGSVPLLLMTKPHRKKVEKEDRKYFLIIGVVGYFLTWDMVQVGISLTGASTAALVNSFNPVSIMLLAALILKEKITPVKMLCLVLAIMGTLIVTYGADGRAELAGIVVTFLATLTWGTASVYMRRLTAKYPPIMVTAYGMFIGLCCHIPVGIATAIADPPILGAREIGIILYLGIIGSGLAQFTWTKSLQQFSASSCSLFYPLQAVFSAILGAVLLQEQFTSLFFVGLALVSADVALCTWETVRTANKTRVY